MAGFFWACAPRAELKKHQGSDHDADDGADEDGSRSSIFGAADVLVGLGGDAVAEDFESGVHQFSGPNKGDAAEDGAPLPLGDVLHKAEHDDGDCGGGVDAQISLSAQCPADA